MKTNCQPKILIIGATGLLGPYLADAGAAHGNIYTAAKKSGDFVCDVTARTELEMLFSNLRPDWVINAAALTDVDKCELKPELAESINHIAVSNLVDILPSSAKLLQISTDQVYPDVVGPHKEETVGPVNVYGRTKLAGEKAALLRSNSLVIRTNFFGVSRSLGREGIYDFLVGKLSNKDPVTLFEDIFFSPLHMKTLSDFIFHLMAADVAGTFNIASREGMSKSDFAIAIATKRKLDLSSSRLGVSSLVSSRAPRPRDLRLDVSRVEKNLGIEMPTLSEEINSNG
ncbi:MAG: SDR family oxidoreductase [Opitutae bacterium]